jgi:hypothetical protein
MRPELKKLLLEKLYHGEENFDKRIRAGDRRKKSTYLANDRRSGLADRRMKFSSLLVQLQDKYQKKLEQPTAESELTPDADHI